ncbi:hypothetical protein BDQ17DRAFT_1437073 [Cyathus striatus]|nr:hypothetical protein BDQ17DRAFT_1437073 [Cyathus striatus]
MHLQQFKKLAAIPGFSGSILPGECIDQTLHQTAAKAQPSEDSEGTGNVTGRPANKGMWEKVEGGGQGGNGEPARGWKEDRYGGDGLALYPVRRGQGGSSEPVSRREDRGGDGELARRWKERGRGDDSLVSFALEAGGRRGEGMGVTASDQPHTVTGEDTVAMWQRVTSKMI